MKLITILTLGLCGRTNNFPPFTPTVKVRIGQEWTYINDEDAKWVAPIYDEKTSVIKITNVSKNGKEVMYQFKILNGKPEVGSLKSFSNNIDWLKINYRLSKCVIPKPTIPTLHIMDVF
jgi:hypothetical protein